MGLIQVRQLKGGGCPNPLPGAKCSSGKTGSGAQRYFLKGTRTELPALGKIARRKNL